MVIILLIGPARRDHLESKLLTGICRWNGWFLPSSRLLGLRVILILELGLLSVWLTFFKPMAPWLLPQVEGPVGAQRGRL